MKKQTYIMPQRADYEKAVIQRPEQLPPAIEQSFEKVAFAFVHGKHVNLIHLITVRNFKSN